MAQKIYLNLILAAAETLNICIWVCYLFTASLPFPVIIRKHAPNKKKYLVRKRLGRVANNPPKSITRGMTTSPHSRHFHCMEVTMSAGTGLRFSITCGCVILFSYLLKERKILFKWSRWNGFATRRLQIRLCQVHLLSYDSFLLLLLIPLFLSLSPSQTSFQLFYSIRNFLLLFSNIFHHNNLVPCHSLWVFASQIVFK